jgi:integrase
VPAPRSCGRLGGTTSTWSAGPTSTRPGDRWTDAGLVFTPRPGGQLDAGNVRHQFRYVAQAAGLDPAAWTPREMRHSFVSLLSDNGVSLEDIADLCGHAGTRVTEAVYRHQLRPVLLDGAVAMDRIFDLDSDVGTR